MKDIFNLTDEEMEKIFRLLKPIAHKEEDDIHYAKIINGELVEVKDGSQRYNNE